MFLSRGDRDLGVASQTHLVSQASSRREAKDSALLSSRDAALLDPYPTLLAPPNSEVAYTVFLHTCSHAHACPQALKWLAQAWLLWALEALHRRANQFSHFCPLGCMQPPTQASALASVGMEDTSG